MSSTHDPFSDWDEEFDWEHEASGFDCQAADLLAGGGYHVE
jgi:hypothetical protein